MKTQVLLVVVHFEGALTTVEKLHKALVEAVLSVGQLDAQPLRLIAQDAREPRGDALKHGIGRGLCGQRDEHSLQTASTHQNLSGCKSQLGLPGPGRRLDDHEIRVFGRGDLHGLALGTGRSVRGRPPKAVMVEVCDWFPEGGG